MATVLDHAIVPVSDRQEAVEFHTRIFGLEDLGNVGPSLAVRVNETSRILYGDGPFNMAAINNRSQGAGESRLLQPSDHVMEIKT